MKPTRIQGSGFNFFLYAAKNNFSCDLGIYGQDFKLKESTGTGTYEYRQGCGSGPFSAGSGSGSSKSEF